MPHHSTPEHQRLADSLHRKADWKKWGPYLSERAWGTVREDYSPGGTAWRSFPHDHARSRTYRWNEDGLGGFCDRRQILCLSVAFWNEEDSILKERLFGLDGNEGNHGEDVKEYYFYLDSTPTHSYAQMRYVYPQVQFPYEDLVKENGRRNRHEPEYELGDALWTTFVQNRYFDVFITYAKAGEEDFYCRIEAVNRSQEAAPLHILPHIWFRNTWAWETEAEQPSLTQISSDPVACIQAYQSELGTRWWYAAEEGSDQQPALLFTENETNNAALFGTRNTAMFVKDGIHRAVVDKEKEAVNPAGKGTKAAAHFSRMVAPEDSFTVLIRLTSSQATSPFADAATVFADRKQEADAFYEVVQQPKLSAEERKIQRQAFAGLMWTKQFYHFDVNRWLKGDPVGPPPPDSRWEGRNHEWRHLSNMDVISMPDAWEYPWYAVWDLAFHALPIAMIDPEWAKRQLILFTREWYMHPNGQLPAYEWALSDVNPPVHAWAAWRVYKIARNVEGEEDTDFLERIFHKMLLNFTWWVNRKDEGDNNVFQGGFLGLDNIGVFDRSKPLPDGGHLDQADGTAWMGMYCLNMLAIALELAKTRPAYEDVATKFFEHFVYIANAINRSFEEGGLWHEDDGFYYDVLHLQQGRQYIPLAIRSFVGLIPLFAVETLNGELLNRLPRFKQRMEWFIEKRPELISRLCLKQDHANGGKMLLSLISEENLHRILSRMLDPKQFLSDYGLRALSKEHQKHPFRFTIDGQALEVDYQPAESTVNLFGGNSNWRGPIWFPVNYLMIEALQKYHYFYGDDFKTEMPVGSRKKKNLWDIATDLSKRLIALFQEDADTGQRPIHGDKALFQHNPHWREHIMFYEYFNGDTGMGLGASHQTGWTALVAKLIQQSGGGKSTHSNEAPTSQEQVVETPEKP